MNEIKYEQASDRVHNSERLAPHADFILANWNEGEEHWDWICTAREEEILERQPTKKDQTNVQLTPNPS